MTTHALRAIAATAALAIGAATAAAQGPAEFESRRVPGWSFTPSFTFGGGYDSNVALADAPADTGRTASDRVFLFQPAGHLEFLSPRTEFGAGYRGNLRRYLEVTELNGFDQQGYVSLRRLASRRLTFFFDNRYLFAPTTDEVDLNGVPFVRTGSRTNTATAGIEARLTRLTSLSSQYELTWVDFDRPDDGRPETFVTGGWVNAWRTEVSRQLAPRFAAGAEYALRFADLNEGTRELTFQDAGGTMRLLVGPHTSLSAAAGVSYLRDALFDETHVGPYYRVGLTHQAERATLGASFQRMFVPSFGFGGSSDSQELRGYVRMPISRNRMYVQAAATWRRSDPFVETELELDTILLRTTFGYSATRWLRVEGFHAYSRQDSQVAGGEIDRHRVGGQIVISQPMRIR
jgi:hypothetical protein